jgi:purine-binding chemotaxis protein CheW
MTAKNLTKNNCSKLPTAASYLPTDPNAQKILTQRAIHFAKVETHNTLTVDTQSYINFSLGLNQNYGIAYEHISEVITNIEKTKLPNTPSFIAGIINRRGSLLTVIDLKKFLHNDATIENNSAIIVVANQNITIGVLTANIKGSAYYDTTKLDAPFPFEGIIKSEYISGIDNNQIAILNMTNILRDCNLLINKHYGVIPTQEIK